MAQSSGHAHDLCSAFERPGCPVCELSRRSVERYLDILAFESVNDVGLRERLRTARGLCNYHSWQFLVDAGQIMGTAIITRDLLRTLRRETDRLPLDSSFARHLEATASCLACEIRRQSEESYSTVLVEQLGSPVFRRAFERSDGVCWYHFRLALAGSGGRRARRLLESWRDSQHALLSSVRQDDQVTALPRHSDPKSAIDTQHPGGRLIRAGKPLGAEVGRRRPRPIARRLWIAVFGEPGLTDAFGKVGPVVVDAKDVAVAGDARSPEGHPSDDMCTVCARVQLAQAEREHVHPGMLCNRHAHVRTSEGNTLAIAQVLEARLDAVERAIRGEPGVEDSRERSLAERIAGGGLLRWLGLDAGIIGERVLAGLPSDVGCSDCEAQGAVEREAIASLASLELAPILCRIHLMPTLTSALSLEVRRSLVIRQHVLWEKLAEELGEYIRKQDYRFRDEPRGEEQSAPWRGLAILAGRPGVR